MDEEIPMKMNMDDRRVKRTQRLLAEALIELTLDKGYEEVTIRDITERADIGYATYFRHYADKDALLAEVLEVVLDELVRLLQQPNADPSVVGTILFQYVQQHSQVCQVLLQSRRSLGLVERMIGLGVGNILSHSVALEGSLVPVEVAAHHLVAAAIALIQWWLDHKMPYPPERMGVIYHELIVRPTNLVAFKAAEAPPPVA
jgi:AcrR family transcriptional regulator